MVLTLVLHNQPPQHTVAVPVNKQAVADVEDKRDVQTATPQPQPTAQVVSAPVQQPEPIPEPVTYPSGCANYLHILARYNWNQTVMAAICQAESGGNPYAVGDTWVINGVYAPSCGLFQIRTLQGRPSCEELKNPEVNIAWAYKIYVGQGYPAWSVCKTKVRCY